METAAERLGEWIIRRRWWMILCTLALVGLLAKGAPLLPVQNDVRIYFGEDNPQLKALQAIEQVYTKNDAVFYVIAPKDGNVFTRRTLGAIRELTEKSWQLPYSSRVESITNFQNTQVLGDDLLVEDLVRSPEKLSDSQLEKIKKTALSEPRLKNLLISDSGDVAGISANLVRPNLSTDETPAVAAVARKIAEAFRQKYPDIDLYLTGEIMQDVVFAEATRDDMKHLLPMMYLAMLIIMIVMLRSILRTLMVFMVIGFSVASSMGAGGWLGWHLNPTTASAPLIILTLAIADSIHMILVTCQYARQGMPKREAVIKSFGLNFKPMFFTSITTAIGFLTMNSAEAVPFREYGNFIAIGVMAAWIYSVFFLPSVLSLFPLKVKNAKDPQGSIWNRYADFIIRNRTSLAWASLAVTLLLTAGIFRIEITDDFNRWYDTRYDFRRSSDFLESHLTGIDLIDYSLGSGSTGGIHEPAYLAKVEEFANWYRNQPHVVHVSSICDTIKRIHQDMHGGDPAFFRIPDNRELIAQYLLLYEMSLPFGHDLNNRIDIDKSATRMSVRIKGSDSRQLLDLDKRAQAWLRQYGLDSMMTDGSGLSMMYAHLIRNNTKSMYRGSLIALLLVVGLLVIALRAVKLSFAAILPNILPILIGFGVWGLIFKEAGIAISVFISMTMGIVVDDSIHFSMKYIHYRRETGATPEDAVRHTFSTVGSSLVSTTMILLTGFTILSFSGFGVNKDTSIITVIILSVALVFDLILLPILLIKAEEKTDEKFCMEPFAATRPAADMSASFKG
jgi:uncharacterized protein